MGLRVLVAERKSRKPARDKAASEDARFRRQENKNVRTAEAAGHVVIERVADTISSQTLPWERKNLRQWFTRPELVDMWDAVLISEVARISRGDSDTWFEIEQWCRKNGKQIMDGSGLTWPSADDKSWDDKRRGAREYWEAVRDTHAEARADVLAAHAAIGRPPFGYRTQERGDGYKEFVIDPVNGPLALAVFTMTADGQTATAVAKWLGEQLGQLVRAKRITDMIRSDSYLGERDGHEFATLAEGMAELVTKARAVLNSRSFDRGGNRVVNAYSARVFCECGAPVHHHQSAKNGKLVGQAKYRCARGRRGIAGEEKCEYPAYAYEAANAAVERAVGALSDPDGYLVAKGGDAARQAKLDAIGKQIKLAAGALDFARMNALQADYEAAAAESADVVRELVLTGKTVGQRFMDSDLDQRREMLVSGQFRVFLTGSGAEVVYEDDDEVSA